MSHSKKMARIERALNALRALQVGDLDVPPFTLNALGIVVCDLARLVQPADGSRCNREERKLLAAGNLIGAVKSLRNRTDLPLREAKVEAEMTAEWRSRQVTSAVTVDPA